MGKFKGHRIFHCTNSGSKEPPQLSKHTQGDHGDLCDDVEGEQELHWIEKNQYDRAVSREKLTH